LIGFDKAKIVGIKGYMPMVGHIAQTGQIVATDFRAGNVSPNTDNFGFINFFKPCPSRAKAGFKKSPSG
jgi:hypothetical protein